LLASMVDFVCVVTTDGISKFATSKDPDDVDTPALTQWCKGDYRVFLVYLTSTSFLSVFAVAKTSE
ncbi:hypothetical protein BaRGS_00035281, partial [Batillaria attramentaria]